MIRYPTIWILFPIALCIFIISSWFLTKSGRLENKLCRSIFVAVGACIGFFGFLLPFFHQPRFDSIVFNYVIGIPLAVFGLIGRVCPMIYLRKKGTTTTLNKVARIVDTGPYGLVRHPQYASGILLLIGWFVIWGAMYCLYLVPLFILFIMVQALIEEKYILEKEFGKEYAEYRKSVGMIFPRIRGK
jgi:protein-S-isoprenylcysteine O-methyltransferase Ste14